MTVATDHWLVRVTRLRHTLCDTAFPLHDLDPPSAESGLSSLPGGAPTDSGPPERRIALHTGRCLTPISALTTVGT